MTQPYRGGCACGDIRYEIESEPMGSNHCQCRQCQRASGTGHGSYMAFDRTTATVTGNASQWVAVGESGTKKAHAFCPRCGSPVYMTFPDIPGVLIVMVASLDEPAAFRPQLSTWAASAQPWDLIDPALPKFEKMPPR